MYIIGITGAIDHGKTSLAKSFLRQIPSSEYSESSILISQVANKLNHLYPTAKPTVKNISAVNAWLGQLPDILKEVTHFNDPIEPIRIAKEYTLSSDPDFYKLAEYLNLVEQNHSLIAVPITPENKETYRPILQWLGGYITKHVNPTMWYGELVRQADEAGHNGYDLFVIGGVRYPSDAQVIKQAGGKILAIERPGMEHAHQEDPTEAYRTMVPTDSVIINDGLVGALDHVVVEIWNDLHAGELKPRYQSSRSGFSATQAPDITSRNIAI